MSDTQPDFAEIARLVEEMPALDLAAPRHTPEALGDWLAALRGARGPLRRPRIAVFAASHGHVPATRRGEAAAAIQAMVDGTATLNRLCEAFDADLRAYDLAVEEPTGDISSGPAMGEGECAHAIAFGMMAVEQGVDLLVVSAAGAGVEVCAEAIFALLGGPQASDPAARAASIMHREAAAPLPVLAACGGRGIAAVAGALIAARYAGCPVVLDGPGAAAAGRVLQAMRADGAAHALAGLPPVAAGAFAVPVLRGAALL